MFGEHIVENPKSQIKVSERKEKDGPITFFTSGSAILRSDDAIISGRNIFLNTGGNADVKFHVGLASYSTDTWSISSENELSDYLYCFLFSIKNELNSKFFEGTSLKHLQNDLLKSRLIYIPTSEELMAFNAITNRCFDTIATNNTENYNLIQLRNFLLPLLMNGQVSIE